MRWESRLRDLQVVCPGTVGGCLKHCLDNRKAAGVVCTRGDQVSLVVRVLRDNVICLVDGLEGSWNRNITIAFG